MRTRAATRLATLTLACTLPFSSIGIATAEAPAGTMSQDHDLNLGGLTIARYVLEDSGQDITSGVKQAVIKQYGPCTLKANNVHVRSSSREGMKIIGFKPVTDCEYPVESIQHESSLKFKYYLWWRNAPLMNNGEAPRGNNGQSKYEQRNIEFQCTGDVVTTFIGNTKGTIVSNGRTFYANVNTEVFKEACEV